MWRQGPHSWDQWIQSSGNLFKCDVMSRMRRYRIDSPLTGQWPPDHMLRYTQLTWFTRWLTKVWLLTPTTTWAQTTTKVRQLGTVHRCLSKLLTYWGWDKMAIICRHFLHENFWISLKCNFIEICSLVSNWHVRIGPENALVLSNYRDQWWLAYMHHVASMTSWHRNVFHWD